MKLLQNYVSYFIFKFERYFKKMFAMINKIFIVNDDGLEAL